MNGAGRTTDWIECFEAGVRRGEPYTLADLDRMAANFKEWGHLVRPTLVIGHEENSGIPAMGRVVDLRRNGRKLEARFSGVPPKLARLVELGAYNAVSAEIYHEDSPPEGVPAAGKMLRRVALLGGELPQVKSLAEVLSLWGEDDGPVKLAERIRKAAHYARRERLPGGTWAVFCEVAEMADDAEATLVKAAIDQKFPGLPPEFIDSLKPDQMGMLADAVAGPPADAPPADDPAAPMADAPSAEQMIADLAALGEDQARLEAMTPDDLYALWVEKKGAPMSESTTAVTTATATPAPPGDDRKPTKVTMQYAEMTALVTRAVATAVKPFEQRLAARDRVERIRTAEGQRQAVRAFCERMLAAGKQTAGQVEFDKAGKPVGVTAKALVDADAVRKFSDRPSELERLMALIEAGPVVRNYAEKVPVAGDKAGQMSPERRRELLGHTTLGRAILAGEARKN